MDTGPLEPRAFPALGSTRNPGALHARPRAHRVHWLRGASGGHAGLGLPRAIREADPSAELSGWTESHPALGSAHSGSALGSRSCEGHGRLLEQRVLRSWGPPYTPGNRRLCTPCFSHTVCFLSHHRLGSHRGPGAPKELSHGHVRREGTVGLWDVLITRQTRQGPIPLPERTRLLRPRSSVADPMPLASSSCSSPSSLSGTLPVGRHRTGVRPGAQSASAHGDDPSLSLGGAGGTRTSHTHTSLRARRSVALSPAGRPSN